jgi:ADP-dependent NAD(P)H-hydrate dehydratase / NAD(P)H-hydrate epimerase
VIPLYRPEQVRAMDQRAFARGVASIALMDRAAGHLARGILRAAGRGYGLRVAILCGKGNNGGDGLAAARRLRAAGAASVVHVVGADPGREHGGLRGDPAVQLQRWQAAGGRMVDSVEAALAGADIAVDCLLGTGSSGEPREPYAAAVEALNRFDGPVVACDLPTGVDAATGRVPGVAVRADLTVTLGAHKLGLWLWPARGYVGELALGELDIRDGEDSPAARVLEAADAAELLPGPAADAHKRTRGVVVVLAGSPGMTGAATLVARGAMAAGAGLVTVATSTATRRQIAPTIPEALTAALPDDPDAAFEALAGHLEGADALAVGPGLGLAADTIALVRRVVAEVEVPLVLDADGLNAFRHEGDALADHRTPLLALTPHARELGRLVGSSGPGVWGQRTTLLPELADAWGATVVAKGPGSLIAAPDGAMWVNPTGSSALATGGTGDVLTGLTVTLLAQRPEPSSVAAAVWLHGLAGEIAGARSHERSVTALDVVDAVPAALRRLTAPLTAPQGDRS